MYETYELSRKEWGIYGAEGILGIAVLDYVFYRNVGLFLVLMPVGILFPLMLRKQLKKRRLETLRGQFKDAILAVASGNIKLEITNIDFVELVQQTTGEFEEKYAIRHLEIVNTLPNEVIMIEADGRRLWRVLENLYNNAFKYALEGTRVYVTIEDHGADVVFTIKNVSANPLNISPDELTERFVRGDVSRTTEGSGLGLSIAKDLTTLQGGKFELIIDGDLFKAQITFPIKN